MIARAALIWDRGGTHDLRRSRGCRAGLETGRLAGTLTCQASSLAFRLRSLAGS